MAKVQLLSVQSIDGYSYKNEELVGKALKPFRHEITISTKFTPAVLPGQENPEGKLSRIGIRQAVEGSLQRLQTTISTFTRNTVCPKRMIPQRLPLSSLF